MMLLPNVLTSIPGIGPVYSAGIMAEIGDINRFESQAKLAKYVDLLGNNINPEALSQKQQDLFHPVIDF